MRAVFILILLPLSLFALSLYDEDGRLGTPAREFLTLFDIPPDLEKDALISLVESRFMQEGKERWEMQGRFEDRKAPALPILEKLGCISPVYAEKMHYNYAIVLGALGKTMQRRLDFLYQEWQRGVCFDQIVLLTGERDLNPEKEDFPSHCHTETDLLLDQYYNSPLYDLVPFQLIDAPKERILDGSIRRPNTASTVRSWLSSCPKPGTCLAVSTQPFVGYQEAVLRYLLPSSFIVEAIGPATPAVNEDLPNGGFTTFPLHIYLDNFARWLIYEGWRYHENPSSKSLPYPAR